MPEPAAARRAQPADRHLPTGFLFGTTSAAYQVEGAADADGGAASVWDVLAAAPGRIVDGSTGPHTVDHFHRYSDDLDLLARLGAAAHRFSVSWSRTVGADPENAARGLDFYDRLVDGLLARGIAPWATLYHWDLPAELMLTDGGWLDRSTAEKFGDYALLVANRLGDRVAAWITMADPWLHMAYGHAVGIDPPGLTLLDGAFEVTHNLLLGHARARDALRSVVSAPVGLANHHTSVMPASNSGPDRRAAAIYDAYHNLQFAEPILAGRYPRLLDPLVDAHSGVIRTGDLDAIAAPLDFYGVDYFHPSTIAAAPDNATVPFTVQLIEGVEVTEAGWPIRPAGLTEVLLRLRHRYPRLPSLYVTESGAAFPPDLPDGSDRRRSDYLDAHLDAVAAAIAGGCPVHGYFYRSLTDGWEGTEGYTQHYGLVGVDLATGDRVPRPAFEHYRNVIARERRG